jgi:hypothetical protein
MNRHDWTPRNWKPDNNISKPIISVSTVMLLIAIAGAFYLGYEYGLDTMYGWMEQVNKQEGHQSPSSHQRV